MNLLSLLMDMDCPLGKVNCQSTALEELCSEKSLGIVQRNHFNRPSVIEPNHFSFVNVRMDNFPVGQNVCFSANALESHALYQFPWEAQLPRETSVDDYGNLSLRREGLQNYDGFTRRGYLPLNGHELRNE